MTASICFVSHSAYGYFSGGEAYGSRQFYLLSQHLTDRFDVHFIVGNYGQQPRQTHNDVTLHRSYSPSPDTTLFEQIQQLRHFWRAVRAADADIYIIEGAPKKLIVFSPIIKATSADLVYHVVSDPFIEIPAVAENVVTASLFRRALAVPDAIVTQTDYQRTTLETLHGQSSTTIPNGYPAVDDVHPHEEREYFLWVGRLTRSTKRPHLCLDLAEQLPDAEFVMAGPKEDADYTDRLLERIDGLDNVNYVGSVDPAEIHDYYRRAVALVNTSRIEGFPNTFLEAWRQATPVLGLSIDPNRFLATPQDCYAEDDLSRLCSLSRRLTVSVDARRQLGEAGLESFEQQYQLSAVGRQYEELLRSV